MLGMEYVCSQYYSYQNLEQLEEILKIDSIGIVSIDKDEQIIKYDIDRQKCLRLSDLIYLINENVIPFYLGQLLNVFTNLLKKVIQLQSQFHINHQYLDQNRIWLMFQNSENTISIVHNQIDYQIAFTGYQCQQYEKGQNIPISANEKIQKIIIDILQQFEQNNIYFNDSQKMDIKRVIYDPIIQFCNQLDISSTLKQIQEILSAQNYDKKLQTIQLDQSFENQKEVKQEPKI